MKIRLDKFLSEVTGASRSEGKIWLKKGRIFVNGAPEKDGSRKISSEEDTVTLDGAVLSYQKYIYIMLHKPAGVVSATKDNLYQTVVDLVRESPLVQEQVQGKAGKAGKAIEEMFPVGRLDKDTEGLLLLTNDGNLAHQLLSPKKHVEKCYFAMLAAPIKPEDEDSFAQGLDIGEEKPTMPAKLRNATPEELEAHRPEAVEGSGVMITIKEGKFHQVKRMAQAIGNEVRYLKRISMGSLELDPALAPGDCRCLTEEECEALRVRN